MRPVASPGMSIPVVFPKPNFWAICTSGSLAFTSAMSVPYFCQKWKPTR